VKSERPIIFVVVKGFSFVDIYNNERHDIANGASFASFQKFSKINVTCSWN